jgi:hypothetical protein
MFNSVTFQDIRQKPQYLAKNLSVSFLKVDLDNDLR